jgi:hypothetical protein
VVEIFLQLFMIDDLASNGCNNQHTSSCHSDQGAAAAAAVQCTINQRGNTFTCVVTLEGIDAVMYLLC